MDVHSTPSDPVAAQQLVARYAALVEQHTREQAFPASIARLPAPKPVIKEAVRTVVDALRSTGQLTSELAVFLEDAFASLANYVDEELATLAAEHRRAGEALETGRRHSGERLASQDWASLARTSRLAGEIARASAEEAAALRAEFRGMLE